MREGKKAGPGTLAKVAHFVRPRAGLYLPGLIISSLTEVSFFVSIPYVVKILIDAAIQKDMSRLWSGVNFILGVSIIGAASFLVFLYLFCLATYRITADIRLRSFVRALGLPASYFERNHSGDTVSRLTNDINTLRNSYDWPTWNFLATLVGGTGAAVVMIILDWRVSSILIASSLAFTLLNMKFSGAIKKASDAIQKSLGSLTESMGNSLAGFAVIKQFDLHGRMRKRFEEHNEDIRDLSLSRSLKQSWLESYNSLIGWINFGGILVLGAYLAGRKLMTFGTMVALVNYLWNVNRMIRETGRSIAQFHGYMAGADRVLELERETAEPALAPPERYAIAESGGAAVRMQGVSFSYDGKRMALDGLDLEAMDGQTVALVGPSGGGKSTVLKLLLGFHEPSEGLISVRGRGGESLSFDGIRESLSYVPQDPFLFDGTIMENIECGKPGAGKEAVETAARRAHADECILKLEKGFDTLVGERGIKLSGGQKQRIAIARAFLKDAPVLLFDEATSSLDSHSERRIQEAISELGGKKTIIVIAHRLSTIEEADVIYVIDQGKVAEKGKHEELLARDGLYGKLHAMQFKLDDGADAT